MIKNLTKYYLLIVLMLGICIGANGQSKDFEIGKSVDVSFAVLRELSLSYIDSVDLESLIKVGVNAMLTSLDPYTVLIGEDDDEGLKLMTIGSYGGIGALIKRTERGVILSEVYKNSPADKAGLLCGDTIMEVDGEAATGDISEVSAKMKGTPGTTVLFKIKRVRSGEVENMKITRERVHFPNVVYSGMMADSVGYIKLTGFTLDASKEVKSAISTLKESGNMKKLLLDLRGNGGGPMEEAVNIVSLFVPSDTEVVSAKGRLKTGNSSYFTKEDPIDTELPLIVLVNSGSASSSEIVAGALQDLDRATIVGTRTFGKGLVQSIVDVGYNNKLKLTTAKYYTPSGRCVQAIDYSNRNEDGSVGEVADSLKREFKTVGGRSVYDGGGITPDVVLESSTLSRPVISLIIKDVFNEYAIQYFEKHKSIAAPSQFHITDEEFDDFVKFAIDKDFDYRTVSEARYDLLVQDIRQEGLYDSMKEEIDGLGKRVRLSKEDVFKLYKKEIRALLEDEIVGKYYYQDGRVESMLRGDLQLLKAIEIKPI